MASDYPIPGSRWQYYTGRKYTVLHTANIGYANPKYPVSVVFIGKNGHIWVKPLDDFLSKMTLEGGK